jgi:hypothetical protein
MTQVLEATAVVASSIALSVGIARLAVGEMFRLARIDTHRNPPM